LELDFRANSIVAVRLVEGAKPQPPQKMKPADFLKWAKKQLALAKEVMAFEPGGPRPQSDALARPARNQPLVESADRMVRWSSPYCPSAPTGVLATSIAAPRLHVALGQGTNRGHSIRRSSVDLIGCLP
jgi:hypothetical protein